MPRARSLLGRFPSGRSDILPGVAGRGAFREETMPIIDMPLSQLHDYQGRNPRPPDMEEFWDAALAEMRSIDPAVELVPHSINAPFAECFHLYFTGVGGARVHANYLR